MSNVTSRNAGSRMLQTCTVDFFITYTLIMYISHTVSGLGGSHCGMRGNRHDIVYCIMHSVWWPLYSMTPGLLRSGAVGDPASSMKIFH